MQPNAALYSGAGIQGWQRHPSVPHPLNTRQASAGVILLSLLLLLRRCTMGNGHGLSNRRLRLRLPACILGPLLGGGRGFCRVAK
jgi:hypothetical protein